MTSSSRPRHRNKYGGIWRRSIDFFKGCSLCYYDAINRRVLLLVCSMNHIPPYLFLWRRRTTMTSETSENTMFVRFYFTLFLLFCLNHIVLFLRRETVKLVSIFPADFAHNSCPQWTGVKRRSSAAHFLQRWRVRREMGRNSQVTQDNCRSGNSPGSGVQVSKL